MLTEAAEAGVVILLTSLAMVEGAVVLAVQAVKVLVLLEQVATLRFKEPQAETD